MKRDEENTNNLQNDEYLKAILHFRVYYIHILTLYVTISGNISKF